MENLKKLIGKYVNEENSYKLHSLFVKLMKVGTRNEKIQLVEGYISLFSQYQYNYSCGKFNNEQNITDLLDWFEKIKMLDPYFDQYHFYRAQIFNMLSSVQKDSTMKLEYALLAESEFKNQMQIDSHNLELLTNFAETTFTIIQLKNTFTHSEFYDDLLPLLTKALHLERRPENQFDFFGFNGSAISIFLETAYQIRTLPFDNAFDVHKTFIHSFKQSIQQYGKTDPSVYYHWAEELLHITEWKMNPKSELCKISELTIKEIWEETKTVLENIETPNSENEQYLIHTGFLFSKIAVRETSIYYHEVAYQYYRKAYSINNKSGASLHYASDSLRSIAYIQLKQRMLPEAERTFRKSLDLLKQVQHTPNDYQFYVQLGDFLFEYAKIFEHFLNKETLADAKHQFEKGIELGENLYTQPYYGLIKTLYRLEEYDECIGLIRKCREVFSNEYYTHDFNGIYEDEDIADIITCFPNIANN